jgi:hypothetical protein
MSVIYCYAAKVRQGERTGAHSTRSPQISNAKVLEDAAIRARAAGRYIVFAGYDAVRAIREKSRLLSNSFQ